MSKISSFKGYEKRKKTLLVEYKNQFKANKFVDKRIGENDSKLSLDEKMFKRFVVERQKRRDRKTNMFNLNDDEENDEGPSAAPKYELTHYGQSIAQMEKFERGDISDDEDDENDLNRGKIGAEIVSENFFGGFKDKVEDSKKSRKDWIEEMIAKSKQAKYERQKERDKTLDLTEQLDKEWKNIIPLIGTMNKKLKDEEDEKARKGPDLKADDFDVLVKKLQFDPKGKPSEKTKSPEELEKERDEESQRQEKALKERMNKEIEPEVENEKKSAKRGPKKAPGNHQSVDDMEFNEPEYLQMWENDKKAALPIEDEAGSEVENGQEDDESGEEEEEEEEVDDDENGDEDGDEDSEASEDSEEEDEVETKPLKDENTDVPKDKATRLNDLKRLLTSYKNLFNQSPAKNKLNTKKLTELTKSIYDLTFANVSRQAKNDGSQFIGVFKDILVDINSEYLRCRPSERKFPNLETLFTFKLISEIFPTSDYRHQITTPCLIMMTRYLAECPVESVGELFTGLFLCNLCYEFTQRSKRYIPECIQFLSGVLYLAAPKTTLSKYYVSTVFEAFKKTKLNLDLSKKTKSVGQLSLVEMSSNESQKADDQTKSSIIGYCLDLIKVFAHLNDSMVCFKETFHVVGQLLKNLPQENYPDELKERVNELECLISEIGGKEREFLKCLSKKPVPNKLIEPRVVTKSKFDPRHHNTVISERQLMTRKVKKEMKSAIKEIRQDNTFLARVQLKEKMEKDAKRTRKVKEIMSSLANQEGEYQKIKRQKI